jgi:hypothetical protein
MNAPTRALFVLPRGERGGFRASVRGHIFDLVDPGLGHALAPTPDDLFVVAVASKLAWSAQSSLRAQGLPDCVSVSANWPPRDELPSLADIDLAVTVAPRAEVATAALAAAFANYLAARCSGAPFVRIAVESVGL